MKAILRRSLPLAAAALIPIGAGEAVADPAELAARIGSAISHADTAGNFVYTLSPSFDGCVLTVVETETEAASPDLKLRETTITIDLARVGPGGIAVANPGGTFVRVTMGDGATVGYVDQYAYGRIDRLDEPEKTLDIAADAGLADDLVAALNELADACRSGGVTREAVAPGGGSTGGSGSGSGGGSGWGGFGGGSGGSGTTTAGEGTDRRAPGSGSWGSGGTGAPVPTAAPVAPVADDDAAWETARGGDTIEAYQTYLDAFPDGAHVLEALQRIAAIGAAAVVPPLPEPTPPVVSGGGAAGGASELDLWRRARLSDDAADYQAYLDAFPSGEFASVARERLDALGAGSGGGTGGGAPVTGGASEAELWRAAILSDDPADYQAYLRAFPDGENAEIARGRLAALGAPVDGGGTGPAIGTDDEMWRAAVLSDDPEAYRAYIRAYPDGERAETARRRLEALGLSPEGGGSGGAPVESEVDMWRRAIFSDDPDDYQAYLRAYPDGENAETARNRLRALGVEPQALAPEGGLTRGITLGGAADPVEDELWASIVRSGDPAEYAWYLDAYPDGAHRREAEAALSGASDGKGPVGGDAASVLPGLLPDTAPEVLPGIVLRDSATAEAAEDALGLGRADRREIQRRLKLIGFDPGPVDGAIGPRTRDAIRAWQAGRGLQATGYLDAGQKTALFDDSEAAYLAFLEERRRPDPPPLPAHGAKPPPVSGGGLVIAPGVRPTADGCPRRNNGAIVPGHSPRCDAIGAMEGIGGVLGN